MVPSWWYDWIGGFCSKVFRDSKDKGHEQWPVWTFSFHFEKQKSIMLFRGNELNYCSYYCLSIKHVRRSFTTLGWMISEVAVFVILFSIPLPACLGHYHCDRYQLFVFLVFIYTAYKPGICFYNWQSSYLERINSFICPWFCSSIFY